MADITLLQGLNLTVLEKHAFPKAVGYDYVKHIQEIWTSNNGDFQIFLHGSSDKFWYFKLPNQIFWGGS
jgi:hypothetical protein